MIDRRSGPREWAPAAVEHGGARVVWTPAAVTVAAALRQLVPSAGRVEVTHECPRCGSVEHGRPTAWIDGRPRPVSTATSGPYRLTALGAAGTAVGVDVESVEQVEQRWTATLTLHPDERADTGPDHAWTWVAKEALLKQWGVGLTRPMSEVRLTDHAAHLRDLEAPDGYRAALAAWVAPPDAYERQGAGGSSF